jgi:putative nucleotidyltransferase with HDIG domain
MKELDDYINRVKHLPPAPKILPQLLNLLSRDDVDTHDVVELMNYDQSLTAAALQLCNSAMFYGTSAATDLDEAVARLGFQQVYELVATVSSSRLMSTPQVGYGLDAGQLWQHSVTTAFAAQLIAKDLDDSDVSLVYTSALLHDIGKIVLSQALEHIYEKMLEDVATNQCSLVEAEKRLLGVNHAEIGARLLARWKFPANIVAAVGFHHHPDQAGEHKRLASYVYLGNMISYFIGYGFGHSAFALRGRAEALEILGLQGDALPRYMIQTYENFAAVNALLTARV